jgi:hypothetical protein
MKFVLILKPETNFFPNIQNFIKSRIEEFASIEKQVSLNLDPNVLFELYRNGFPKFPNSYSRDEILWIHEPKWGESKLLLINYNDSVEYFRENFIGGIYFQEGTMRKYWQYIRDNSTNSLDFWQERGLEKIPKPPTSRKVPSDAMSPDRLYLLLNGIHCPKDIEEMKHDTSILSKLF